MYCKLVCTNVVVGPDKPAISVSSLLAHLTCLANHLVFCVPRMLVVHVYIYTWDIVLYQVVGLGVRGVFTIIQDVWQSMPSLCLRALREFLNILQGQSPAGLHQEPKDTTG